MIRTANALTSQRRIAEILRGQERLEAARDQVSSGRRLQRPSDSPTEIAELLRTRSNVVELTRRRDSADAFLPAMKASVSALDDMTNALREVRTLTLQAVNGTTNPEQRQVLGDQIDRIRARIVSLGNTQIAGRYLFAGTNTSAEPFAAGPPVVYSGNTATLEVSLNAGPPFSASVSGQSLLNARGGTDLFQNLSRLEAAIRSGDTGAMSAGLKELDADYSNIVRQNGDMGARVQYVELVRRQLDDDLTSANARQSQLQDVDLASAVIEEKTAENAQEATLAMAGRIDRPSLLDYLR